jgi:hypothetical protein
VQPFSPSSLAGLAPAAQQPNPSNDRQTLERLEHEWLQSEHDGPALQRLLADDFLHPVAAGVFLTKQQHIDWAVSHPAPTGRRKSFENLLVRVYGATGIATGIVLDVSPDGHRTRTIFTDVFVRRGGRWQAVNAQENAIP